MISGSFRKHLSEQMKAPAFKKAWHELDSEFELIESMIKAREKSGLSQSELSRRTGIKQPAISRLEKGGYTKATVETLRKIADALDSGLVIKLRHKRG